MKRKKSRFLTETEKHQVIARYCELMKQFCTTESHPQSHVLKILSEEFRVSETTLYRIKRQFKEDGNLAQFQPKRCAKNKINKVDSKVINTIIIAIVLC